MRFYNNPNPGNLHYCELSPSYGFPYSGFICLTGAETTGSGQRPYTFCLSGPDGLVEQPYSGGSLMGNVLHWGHQSPDKSTSMPLVFLALLNYATPNMRKCALRFIERWRTPLLG